MPYKTLPRPATYSKRQLREYVERHEARGETLFFLRGMICSLRDGVIYYILDDRDDLVIVLQSYLHQIGRVFESEAELLAFRERHGL